MTSRSLAFLIRFVSVYLLQCVVGNKCSQGREEMWKGRWGNELECQQRHYAAATAHMEGFFLFFFFKFLNLKEW